MSTLSDLMKAMRDVALLTHRVDQANTMAKEANDRSLENRDRIGRIETALNFMMRDLDAQRRLPPLN